MEDQIFVSRKWLVELLHQLETTDNLYATDQQVYEKDVAHFKIDNTHNISIVKYLLERG